MGLDIYLQTAAHRAEEKAYYEASDAAWDGLDYDALTDEQKQAVRDSLPPRPASRPDVPSKKYPDHLCNRTYLRSSYNAGGFNHAAPEMLGTVGDTDYPHADGSFYWIFAPVREHFGDEPYEMHLAAEHVAALNEARKRALDVAERLRSVDPLRVSTVAPNVFMDVPTATEADAIRFAREQIEKAKEHLTAGDDWGSYGWSTGNGDFYGLDGLTILAAMPGRGTLGVPAVHLVHRLSEDVHLSYVHTAEIAAEFCEEALSLIERDGAAAMSWSG